ncbi:hypothetical protein JW899_00075 [Candidatus Uhrbacteria bacterium]|nr:hypothetical protein [Candidatus Uhrbacteria bacterium]
MNEDLKLFIRESLVKKLPREEIRSVLAKGGWPKDEIEAALGSYAEIDFAVPVPKPRPYLSAKEAFIYLLLFVCLYLSAFNFGKLTFQYIHGWFPDALKTWETPNTESIRMSLASLIVSFPLYLWLTGLMTGAIRRDPDKRSSKIRKWLTYITLFVAAGVIIGDMIVLIFNLLGGELTTRFLLKVLTVLAIAGLIFGYYLWDLRKEEV